MTFDEWLNGLDTNGVYGDDFAKAAWDAAIDEAVNIIYTQGEYVDPNDLADEVKELKK